MLRNLLDVVCRRQPYLVKGDFFSALLESYFDEAIAAPYLLQAIEEANASGFDAVIIAAFCDPAIEAAKEISTIPVYSLEETTFSVALLLGNRFSILTEKKHKVSVKQRHIRKYGLESRFASVRPLNMGVTEIASDPARVRQMGLEVGRLLVEEDGTEVIIMGYRVDDGILSRPRARTRSARAGSSRGHFQGRRRTHGDRGPPLKAGAVRATQTAKAAVRTAVSCCESPGPTVSSPWRRAPGAWHR